MTTLHPFPLCIWVFCVSKSIIKFLICLVNVSEFSMGDSLDNFPSVLIPLQPANPSHTWLQKLKPHSTCLSLRCITYGQMGHCLHEFILPIMLNLGWMPNWMKWVPFIPFLIHSTRNAEPSTEYALWNSSYLKQTMWMLLHVKRHLCELSSY